MRGAVAVRREESAGRWGGASRADICSTGAGCDGGSASGAPLAASVKSQSVNVGSKSDPIKSSSSDVIWAAVLLFIIMIVMYSAMTGSASALYSRLVSSSWIDFWRAVALSVPIVRPKGIVFLPMSSTPGICKIQRLAVRTKNKNSG
jgi:hypothetical protein